MAALNKRFFSQQLQTIARLQQPDGSFFSYSTALGEKFEAAPAYHTVFFPAMILSCLARLENLPEAVAISRKIARFLQRQASRSHSFNYWAADAPEAKSLPYPDDCDDTFCALSALYQHEPKFITGAVLSDAINILTSVEAKVGGPYRTWLVEPTATQTWFDVDVAVNANIGHFLKQQGVDLPSIHRLAKQAVTKKQYHSRYYPDVYPVVYFIARLQIPELAKGIAAFLTEQQQPDGSWGNPLDTALALLALSEVGSTDKVFLGGQKWLLQSGQRGQWQRPYPFCLDPSREGQAQVAGSSALTIAFCLAAAAASREVATGAVGTSETEERFIEQVYRLAEQYLRSLPSPLRPPLKKAINRLQAADATQEIVLLPWWLRRTLSPAQRRRVSLPICRDLALASLLGWAGYDLLDDVVDADQAPSTAPAATAALRAMQSLFLQSVPSPSFQRTLYRVLDDLDAATLWEASRAVFQPDKPLRDQKLLTPRDYGSLKVLGAKSLGHALSALAMLSLSGRSPESRAGRVVERFFRHYLIARQLNDDAHDWLSDLRAGRLNPASATVIAELTEGERAKTLDSLAPKLEKVFWRRSIIEITAIIEHHLRRAEIAAKQSGLASVELFERMLEPIRRSTQKTVREQRRMAEFVDRYAAKKS